ncbi:MAG: glycosyltransferase family 4 protein [Frankiaceae bacterium]|nr:glycosyltransferase family 4 protein [Frankiaceae bacterium]MBV9871020.1 glycosyltransferase family 4 protein [Frankiaceae bacterium]
MRIALLSYRSKPHCGGQGVYVRHVSRELAELGHHVEVISGQPYPILDAGPHLTELPSLDLYADEDPFRVPNWREFRDWIDLVEFASMGTGGFPEPLTFSLRAARMLKRRLADFDVVHDNQTLGYGMNGIAKAGLPLIATIHHPCSVDRVVEIENAPNLRQNLGKRRWYSFTRMQGRVARKMSSIVTVSTNSASDIVRDYKVDPDVMRIVPIGVDTTTFRPPTAPRVPGRIVAVSSSDSPIKGVKILLEAVAKLRTGHDVELVVVGKPNPDGPVSRAVVDLNLGDTVRFVSGLSNDGIAELFASAEIAVVPSLYEGFSIPAVEAMACATPLIATTGGALPEVAGTDGSTAVLVKPGDPAELADALSALFDDADRRQAIGLAGRRRVETSYTWRAVAESMVEVYRDAIERTASQRVQRDGKA